MEKLKSIQGKITPEFIDYCNDRNISLTDWYRWQLHLVWEQRRINRKFTGEKKKAVCTK